MRRIRSVALSLPAIAGPQVGVHCTLSLLRSSVRLSPALKGNAYARQGLEDERFANYFGAIQSVVTSTGANDAGGPDAQVGIGERQASANLLYVCVRLDPVAELGGSCVVEGKTCGNQGNGLLGSRLHGIAKSDVCQCGQHTLDPEHRTS